MTEHLSQQADATLCHVLGRIEPIPAEEDAGERPPEKGTGNARPYLVMLLGELRQLWCSASGQTLTQGRQKWPRRPPNSKFTKT